jgi:hypothetical protein
MNGKKPKMVFWTLLATLNVVALYYPVSLVLDASKEHVRATVLLIAVMVVLSVSDAISVLIEYHCIPTQPPETSPSRRTRTRSPSLPRLGRTLSPRP